MQKHYQILIIGGGSGGIMTAANLLTKDKSLKIGIIEPAEFHYYQAAWTLVGANSFDFEKTKKKMADVIPPGADWIKDKATGFKSADQLVLTENSGEISYDYLVVSPGLIMDPSLIEGLQEAMDKGVVCSNYTNPKHTWETLKNFKGGNAIFTQPTTPIKCGGAPQKIAYLAADYFKKTGLTSKTNVVLAMPGSVIFGVPVIKNTLMEVVNRYGIKFKPSYAPVKIDADKKIITFKNVAPEENKCVINTDASLGETLSGESFIEMPFDMLHIAPPQTPPKFIKESDLVNEAGWMDVDINTLQSKKYPRIFGIGDVAALPTAKTGAAIRKQVPVVVGNILHLMKHDKLGTKIYEGYSSCPLVTGYGKMVLAEFNYKNEFTPDPKLKQMLVFNSDKEHWRLWMLKKHILPNLYWNKMLKGKEV
jgi:sulfide:quinone oxidoreductase